MNELAIDPDIKFDQHKTVQLWQELGDNLDPWGNEYQLVERKQ